MRTLRLLALSATATMALSSSIVLAQVSPGPGGGGSGGGGTSSGFSAAFPATGTAAGAEYLASPPTLTNGQMVPFFVDANGNLKVNIVTGAGSGGTAITDNTAFTQGAAGGTSETPVSCLFKTAYTAATSGNSTVVRCDSSGQLLVAPSTAAAWSIGATAAAVPASATYVAGVNGTNNLQGFSVDSVGGQKVIGEQSNGAATLGNPVLVGGSNGTNTYYLSVDTTGKLNINNISGTITLPTGAATSANQPTNSAIGATTSGQTGNLSMGAVTTGAPTYTTAQTNPLSLDTAGNLRTIGTVNPTSAANWGVGATGSAVPANGVLSMMSNAGTGVALQGDSTNGLWVNIKSGAGSGGTAISDNHAFTQSTTNETPMGCLYITSYTAATSGNSTVLQCDSGGAAYVNVKNALTSLTPGDGVTTGTYASGSPTLGGLLLFNGTTYDRQRSAGVTGAAMVGGATASGASLTENPLG